MLKTGLFYKLPLTLNPSALGGEEIGGGEQKEIKSDKEENERRVPMCYKMRHIGLGILLVTMAVFSSNAQAVVISFEQSEGFPAACNSYAGMAVPSGIVDNWTAPTGSNLFIDDGPGGCEYPDAPAPITGTQEAVVQGPTNINSTVVMDLTDSANLRMSSFYWAYRGNGNSRCESEGYGAQTAFLDVKYYDLSGSLLGTDTFCGGLNPDWSPKLTLATPSASYQNVPLSKVEFIGRVAAGYPTPWHATFFLEDITVVPLYPASTATPLATDLSMNQYKLKDAGDIITKGPWVDARAYNNGVLNDVTINAAITAIGTNKKTLLLAPGTWSILANVTVPSNINLRFEQGAVLSLATGVSFNINGPIDAPISQIFSSGMDDINFGLGYVKEVYPQWWGAKGDGTNDDTAAINAAITSGCKRIYFTKPSVAYAFTGLTIAADTTSLSLIGEPYGVELRYTLTTGNGITFAGQADNFTMKNIALKAVNNSSGTAILSTGTSGQPLRDHIFENLNITGFLKGIIVQGGMNGKIIGGRYTGQGKTVTGGIGISFGEDVNHSYNHGLIEHVHVESYETGVHNRYCGSMHLEDAIIRTTSVALKNDNTAITYADNLNADSTNDTMINNVVGGYIYYRSTGGGTQPVVTAVHRIFREGHDGLARVNVYRGTSEQSIPTGTATKLQFNGEREDTEYYFDSTTNYRFTAPFAGYYRIAAMVQWRTGTTNKEYRTMIYRNGALLTEHIYYSRGTVPYYFSSPCSTMVWLDKDDYIEVYVKHDEGVNSNIGIGDGKTYLVVVSM